LGEALFLLLILIAFSAFFSGSEIAMMSLSKIKVMQLMDQKQFNAKILNRLKQNPHKLLVTILIGNNLANISASVYAESVAYNLFSSHAVGITIGVMTFLILVFGEIIPKSFCIRHAERISLTIAPLILFFYYLFFPAIWVLDFLDSVISKADPSTKKPLVTEEELRTMVKVSGKEGSINRLEQEMINRVLELNDIEVKEIMTPRVDMFRLECSESIKSVIQEVIRTGFSRIPVFEERVDDIKGIVYIKDLLSYIVENKSDVLLKEVMKQPIFVPENKMISSLLKQFLQSKIHMAMVVDEYGGIQGLITIEDILEELVGEIYDEKDKPEQIIQPLKGSGVRVLGKAELKEVNRVLNLNLEEMEAFDTISGFILHHLGHIPKPGESLDLEEVSINIDKMEGNRITEVILFKKEKEKDPEKQEN